MGDAAWFVSQVLLNITWWVGGSGIRTIWRSSGSRGKLHDNCLRSVHCAGVGVCGGGGNDPINLELSGFCFSPWILSGFAARYRPSPEIIGSPQVGDFERVGARSARRIRVMGGLE